MGTIRFSTIFSGIFLIADFEPNYKRTSLGSGVIIDGKRGYVLTNAHVIANAGTVKVIFKDEREYQAQIVGADPDSDLAVLQDHHQRVHSSH